MPGTVAGGVAITTRSGFHGRSRRRRAVVTPSIVAGCRLTSPIGPPKPASSRLLITARPTERGRDRLPTTATEVGRKMDCRR
jgi:hypothetical protein